MTSTHRAAHVPATRHAKHPTPSHPVGLLYTLLRHGRGLSHEEAARASRTSIAALPHNKAA